MSRKMIGIIVALLATIIVLRYFEGKAKRSSVKEERRVVKTEVPSGRELPEESGKDIAEEESQWKDNAYAVFQEALFEPACQEGTLENIVSAHGTIWGVERNSLSTFTGKESGEIYRLLYNLAFCRSVAAVDFTYCRALPEFVRGKRKYLRSKCEDYGKEMIYAAYAAGIEKSEGACDYILETLPKTLKVPRDDFCRDAAMGFEGFCRRAVDGGYIPADMFSACKTGFPEKPEDCGGEKGCLRIYSAYRAFKSGDCSSLKGLYRKACTAYLAKTDKPCMDIAGNLSRKYCRYLKNVENADGHVERMNDEERREYLKKIEEERKMKELARKEEERLLNEINEKVRKMMKESENEEEK